jgi:hypothetical protein
MKRLGPELKMPDLKVPPFAADLFHDLRDRRLLPLIGLVLVAIVSVPFLLGSDSEEAIPAPESSAIEELKAEAADPASLTVVEAKPGLRDYRRRLRARRPTDPFVQRYTGAVLNGADLPESVGKGGGGEAAETTTVTETKTEATETVTETGTGGGGGSGGAAPAESGSGSPPKESGDGKGAQKEIVLYSFAIDVRIVKTSGEGAAKQTDEPVVKHRVLPTTPLPGPKAPVVTYMGISPKTKKPTFLVSTDVTAMFGEGKCASGTDVCQLVELEPGFPQTFVHGEGGTRYKLKVLDVKPVANGSY